MILVDTSVWVDFLKHQPFFFPTLQTLIETQAVVAAACVFGELLQGSKNAREKDVILGYWENLPKREEAGIWIEAGLLFSTHKWFSQGVGLIDAFLICFARTHQLQIWTLDKKLLAVLKPTEVFTPAPIR